MDDARLQELFGDIEDVGSVDRELLAKVQLGDRIVPEALFSASGLPRMMASNNWVVAGSRTKSGAPMLANDPHLEVNRLPNVWVETVATWGDDYALCMTMPGLPAPLVGRTRTLSWGATYTFMDAVDSWVEQAQGGRLRRGERWIAPRRRAETIKRKGGQDVEAVFYETEHGVIDGDPTQDGFYLSTRWAPGDSGAASLISAHRMWTARTVEDARTHLGRIETAWNWVIADREGDIGYQMSGLLPKRRPGVSGFVPLRGWAAEDDWQGFVEPERLPRCINPPQGYIVTANQDLNALGEVAPINMPMGDYRAVRIAQQLDTDGLTLEDFQRIHYDDYSAQAPAFLEVLLPVAGDGPAARALRAWDYRYDPESVGASVFEAFYERLLAEAFGRGGLGEQVIEHLLGDSGIFVDFYRNVDRVLLRDTSVWFDGRTQAQLFSDAFSTIANMQPRPWGERNRVVLTNIFFGGKLPRFLGFDRGPVALRGGRATPHQGQVYVNAGRATSFAPSMRFVTDLGQDCLLCNLAGGPSDRRFSRWYASDLANWQTGRYKTLRPD